MQVETVDPGHRASKKIRTRNEILANAISFFRRAGVRGAKSAHIAAASGVSSATLFNYFPTRGELASAWVRGELDRAIEAFAADPADRGSRVGLRGVCRELAGRLAEDAETRLEAWRLAGRAPSGPQGPGQPARQALERVIRREQDRDRMRSDLAAAAIADLIVDALEGGMISMLEEIVEGGESKEPGDRMRALQGRLDLVLDGGRKRNERVDAPRPRRAGVGGRGPSSGGVSSPVPSR